MHSDADHTSHESSEQTVPYAMKTHKRPVSAADSSRVPAELLPATTSGSPCSPTHSFLRQHGYVKASISDSFAETLSIVVKVFQAQLEVLSKQQPQNRHAGYKHLGRKQRLEFRSGDSALGQLGMLQAVATTVRDLSFFLTCSGHSVYPCLIAGSELRWCKPLTTLPENSWKA